MMVSVPDAGIARVPVVVVVVVVEAIVGAVVEAAIRVE